MSLHLGRLEIRDPKSIERTPRGISVEGAVNRDVAASITMDQLIGLGENLDEPVVPVWWDHDPILDGFYRVGTPQWRVRKEDGEFGNSFPWTAELERIRGNPGIESHLIGAVRANDHSITDANAVGWHAVPYSVRDYVYEGETVSATERSSEDGSVVLFVPTTSRFTAVNPWSVPIGDFYRGAARVLDGDGNLLLGRSGVPVTISNGTLKVSLHDDGDDQFIRVVGWSGDDWGIQYDWSLGADIVLGSTVQALDLASARILRNSPEIVSIRLGWGTVAGALIQVQRTLDLTLRRGARMVECTAKYDDDFAFNLTTAGSPASTEITGGGRATSNDVKGDRWVVASAQDFDFVDDGILSVGASIPLASPWQFAVGVEVGGSTAAGANAAQQLIYQYMAAQDERQMVVLR